MKVWQTFFLTAHMFFAVYLGTTKESYWALPFMAATHFIFGLVIGGVSRGEL